MTGPASLPVYAVGTLLAIGGAAGLAMSKGVAGLQRIVGTSTVIVAILAAPALAIAIGVMEEVYIPIPNRYGTSLLPWALLSAGLLVDRRPRVEVHRAGPGSRDLVSRPDDGRGMRGPRRDSASVHVVIAYWGEPELLDRAVDSVLAQTDPDWRLTIVDDHYPDLHAQQTYAAHPDARIDYVRNTQNLGLTRNFERCRTLADGDLVAFLGCDDLLLPDYVAELRRARVRHPDSTIFQPGVRVIDSDGRPSLGLSDRVKAWLTPSGTRPVTLAGEDLASSLMRGNWMYWPSLAFEHSAVADHSFRTDLPIVLDLAFVMDLVLDGAELVVLDAVTFCYRRHGDSASSLSSVRGSRFDDEKAFYREMVVRLEARGWDRAAGVARRRIVSRLNELSLVPGAVRRRLRRTRDA